MNSNYKLLGLQDVEVVGQFETGTSGQAHLLNSKISIGTARGKACVRAHARTHTHTHTYYTGGPRSLGHYFGI